MPVVELTSEDGLATMRIGRAHGNAIDGELVEGLSAACRRAEEDAEVRGVLFTSAGKLFCPGLDLQDLVELDRPAMEAFVAAFNACVLRLYTFPKPLVAAIRGHAVAGGCVLTLTADWRVLRRGALIGLNEVRVGVPLPFGVATILRESVSGARLEEIALFGRNYTDEQALRAGLAHELADAEGFEELCLERLRELADKDPAAFSMTKAYLRGAAVERIRARAPRHDAEFLDAWFSAATRERIRGIVEQLRSRGG